MSEICNLGITGNAAISFNISHLLGVDIDYFEIRTRSWRDEEFDIVQKFHGINSDDLDKLCEQLQSLKSQLKYNRKY
jgi:hypothetical protein